MDAAGGVVGDRVRFRGDGSRQDGGGEHSFTETKVTGSLLFKADDKVRQFFFLDNLDSNYNCLSTGTGKIPIKGSFNNYFFSKNTDPLVSVSFASWIRIRFRNADPGQVIRVVKPEPPFYSWSRSCQKVVIPALNTIQ